MKMPNRINDELFNVSGRDLTYLVQQQKRITNSNLFKKYLDRGEYKIVGKGQYTKGQEVILLFSHYGEQRYINKNLRGDSGNMIQFIMNRLNENNKVKINNELPYYCQAVEICLDFENHLLSKKKYKNNPRIVKEAKNHKRKR